VLGSSKKKAKTTTSTHVHLLGPQESFDKVPRPAMWAVLARFGCPDDFNDPDSCSP